MNTVNQPESLIAEKTARPKKVLRTAFFDSLPAFFGYFPLGIVVGFLFGQLDIPWYLTTLMAGLSYGASAQLLALNLMLEGETLVQITLTTLVVYARSSFYGLSFLERYKTKWWKKCLLAFTLVDATYSILTSKSPSEDREEDLSYCLALSAMIYCYSLAGTALGALMGDLIPEITGMEFILTAVFVVLALEQYLHVGSASQFVIAAVAGIVAKVLFPQHLLLAGILLSFCALFVIHASKERAYVN